MVELKVVLHKMQLPVDDEDVLFLMSRYDDDGNGNLNFDEFRYFLHFLLPLY